ncbi:restriction endonuclease subunit S [Facklamia hominis]|uniref:restriction endonuclease subunit S n=1 Tax=Facklamia hominis TaxID=178214 RepID=UPI0038FCC053
MTEWKEYTVQELIDLDMLEPPVDGNHGGIHPKTSDYVESGVPFIMVNNMNDGEIDLDNCAFITEEQAATLKKGISHPGDVLLSHKASIGRTAIVPNLYETIILTPQITYYRTKKGINNRYLKYYFDSSFFQNTLNNWAGAGSTRAYLGITAQRKLPIIIPDMDTQYKLVSILSGIDEKIANNKKINKNLAA